MSKSRTKIDRFLLTNTLLLSIFGFLIFLSASLGLLANQNSGFYAVATTQSIGLVIGLIAFFIISRIPSSLLRIWSWLIFTVIILINLLIFVPQLSVSHGGATRWIDIGFTTIQPSELLKIGFIIYLAAWIHFAKDRMKTFRYGILPFIIMISFVGLLLLAQPDTDTLVVIFITGIIMLFVSGANWKYLGSLLLIMIIGVLVLASFRPYLKDRLLVYVGMKDDVEGSAYQINQSQIAIGSGQIVGRGFGQSIQKFGYLPQPTDDSIFAVLAEEFGFIGSSLLILLYISYTISTYRIGTRTKDIFGSRLAIGVGTLVFVQSMLNIATMIGVIPLAGLPLLFISHGGTALVIILMASGMVASVSRNMD